MKHRTLSDLRNLTAFGLALLFCVGSLSMNAGYSVASSGALADGAITMAAAIGVVELPPAPVYGPIDTCTDLLDSDGDSVADCSDPDCYGNAYCTGYESSCSNGIDDDSDGLVDCSDIECAASLSCKNI
jgi:hypothetical protein